MLKRLNDSWLCPLKCSLLNKNNPAPNLNPEIPDGNGNANGNNANENPDGNNGNGSGNSHPPNQNQNPGIE